MGTYRSGQPPAGGQLVFDVVPAHKWLAHTFQPTYWGTVQLILGGEADTDACLEEVQVWVDVVHLHFQSDVFKEGEPGRYAMGYCGRVEYELSRCIVGRMEVVKRHRVWNTLRLDEKVHLIYRIIYDACLRCAEVRGCAYQGLEAPTDERTVYKDRRGVYHVFDTHLISPVASYGPGKQ